MEITKVVFLDKEYFSKCMKLLCNTFDKDFTQEQAVAYYATLKECSNDQMQFMTKKVCEEDTFFPKPADLLKKLKTKGLYAEPQKQIYQGQAFTKEEAKEILNNIF